MDNQNDSKTDDNTPEVEEVIYAYRPLSEDRYLVLTHQHTPKTGKQRKDRHYWKAELYGPNGEEVLAEIEIEETLKFLPHDILDTDEWAPEENFTYPRDVDNSDTDMFYAAVAEIKLKVYPKKEEKGGDEE